VGTEDFMDTLRVRPMDRKQLLDNLDHASKEGDARARRNNQRMEYRADKIQLSVTHPGGTLGRFYVKARNLSAGGLSFLHGGFLHIGTECKIVLISVNGDEKIVLGKVRACRYISANVHEVGVQFYEKLEIARYVNPYSKVTSTDGAPAIGPAPVEEKPIKLSGDALVVSSNGVELKTLAQRLDISGMNVVQADCVGVALDQLKRLPIDLVLWADGPDTKTVAAHIATIRAAGYKGAIVAILNSDSPPPATALDPGGVCSALARPIDVQELVKTISEMTVSAGSTPILSELAPNSNSSDLINFFVDQTRTAARELAEALVANDIEAARKTCRTIKSTAGGYGFPGVAEAARHADTTLDTSAELAEATKQIHYLIGMLRRVKGGYASAKPA